MTVEWHGGLQAERVASPETAWLRSPIKQLFPRLAALLRIDDELETVFPGVTGPAQDALLATVSRSGPVVVGQRLDGGGGQPPAELQDFRPLNGYHARVPRPIL